MNEIHVCVGSCGEYSDHQEWYVRAFEDRQEAEHFTEAVAAEYRRIYAVNRYCDYPEDKNPLDPDMRTDYTGTNYYLVTVPFQPKVPK